MADHQYGNGPVIKDSGARHEFGTGAHRDLQDGKGTPVLLSPLVMRRLSQHMELGSLKYGERNWERGIPLSAYYNSAQRHMQDLLEGLTDEDHAIAVLWNMHCFIHTRIMIARGLMPEELDDMPDYTSDEYEAANTLLMGNFPTLAGEDMIAGIPIISLED